MIMIMIQIRFNLKFVSHLIIFVCVCEFGVWFFSFLFLYFFQESLDEFRRCCLWFLDWIKINFDDNDWKQKKKIYQWWWSMMTIKKFFVPLLLGTMCAVHIIIELNKISVLVICNRILMFVAKIFVYVLRFMEHRFSSILKKTFEKTVREIAWIGFHIDHWCFLWSTSQPTNHHYHHNIITIRQIMGRWFYIATIRMWIHQQ